MIWLFFFLTFFLFVGKEFYFFSYFVTLDNFNLFMTSIFFIVALLIFYSNFNSVIYSGGFFFLFSYGWILFFLSLTFSFSNFFLFLLGLELCVFLMMKLILDLSKDLDKVSSSFFMYFMNSLGVIPFMILSVFDMEVGGYTSFLGFIFSLNSSPFFFICFFLILVSKVPIFVMHFWLTKAHVSASGGTSMILASLMLKIGTFGILKFGLFFLVVGLSLMGFNCWISLLGSLMMCMVMFRYFDVKYVIACSSIVHMSFIIPMSLSSDSLGSVSSIYMMLGHGLISYFLFFMVSIFYEISVNRSMDFNKSLEAYSKTLSMWFIVFLILNLGFPPFISFLSEVLTNSFFVSKSFFMVPVLLMVLLLSVFYFIFLVTKILFGKKHLFFAGTQDSLLDIFSISLILFTFFLPMLF